VSYGRTWSATNAERVVQAAARNGARITITVLDPDAPGVLIDFYGETYSTDAVGLRERIGKYWKPGRPLLSVQLKRGVQSRFRIEGVTRHTPSTFYRAGDCVWVILTRDNPVGSGMTFLQFSAAKCLAAGEGFMTG
jgi:hypothetical protein